MSTDTDRAAAEKAEADKKAAEDAAAAVTATATAWPIGGYTSLIPLVFLSVVAVLAVCVDVSTICVVHALLDHNQYVINAVHVMLMIYSWINLIEKLPIYSTGLSNCAREALPSARRTCAAPVGHQRSTIWFHGMPTLTYAERRKECMH